MPGRYYRWLNFKIIDGIRGPQYPDFIDCQLEFYEKVEDAKVNHKLGFVVPKGRRLGLSFMIADVIDYGLRFIPRYRAGVAAGLEGYVMGFRSKLYRTYNNTAPEFMLNHKIKNDNSFILGWEE